MAQSQPIQESSQKKAGRRRNENNVIYANPLPIIFSPVENRFAITTLGIFGISPTRVLIPRCRGIFDPISRSVWITDSKDRMILWRRGFFGKGNLSRSEPSWLVRLANSRSAAGRRESSHLSMLYGIMCSGSFRLEMTSEEVTARRRAERKQFKLDRAQAIAAAAAEAEAAFAEGRVISIEETKTSIPSAATWKPSVSIQNATLPPSEPSLEETDLDAEPPEDMEHLQLTLPEAFFLSWALDCLSICHPKTVRARCM
jgi:tRNA-splicing endonuclease subunit Sen2